MASLSHHATHPFDTGINRLSQKLTDNMSPKETLKDTGKDAQPSKVRQHTPTTYSHPAPERETEQIPGTAPY